MTERSCCNLDGDFNIITVIVWVSGLDIIEQDLVKYLISHRISPWQSVSVVTGHHTIHPGRWGGRGRTHLSLRMRHKFYLWQNMIRWYERQWNSEDVVGTVPVPSREDVGDSEGSENVPARGRSQAAPLPAPASTVTQGTKQSTTLSHCHTVTTQHHPSHSPSGEAGLVLCDQQVQAAEVSSELWGRLPLDLPGRFQVWRVTSGAEWCLS